ncbi:60S acidic ribosomal protein P1-alpha 3 [Linnemannia zychae]|nr:60S acidic ribosomal protein P1-alpha 3 [Linnemannia zychae]
MTLPTTKRINSAMLQSTVGETVRFVGELKGSQGNYTRHYKFYGVLTINMDRQGNVATFLSSDKGIVAVSMSEGAQYGTKFMEVIGTVNADRSINEMVATNFGNSFDLDAYDAMIVKAQKFPSVF